MKRAYMLLLLALTFGAHGQALTDQPGYVDFGEFAGLGLEPQVEVSLGSALIGFLAAAAQEEDPELATTLRRLRSIRLNVFELPEQDVASVKARVNTLVSTLKADAWEPAVSVKGEDATIHLYMKTVNDKVAGMTVMMIDSSGEAVFMNIVGEIDPAQLGKVAARFGVDADIGLD